MQTNLKIAIQKKGHLRNQSIIFLRSLGFDFDNDTTILSSKCSKTGIEVIFLRDDDIPKYLNKGLVDFGIIGKDVIEETKETIKTTKPLGFSKCKLVIAVPKNSNINNKILLQNKTIATTYPNVLRKYLKENNIYAKVIYLSGSVEIAPKLKLSDLICDITQTGNSLKQNNLRIIETILESEAVLIESPVENSQKNILLDKLEQYENCKSKTI
ncbi:ATP phosphoribosyltransferase [Patescibacteria group bacterium]|nr:ATP phosphoribosyltransferase [Patescibacteria group bacterium]